jgi:hypothetical protein
MRRAVRTLLVGGVLFTIAACGTAAKSGEQPAAAPGGSAAPAAAALSPEQAATKSTCEALGKAFDKSMAPFAEALTKFIAGKEGGNASPQQAQAALKSFATEVRTATESSPDAQIKADGKQTADRLQERSADKAFFAKIKTDKDVSTLLGPTLKEWLSPVTHHCS